MNAQEHAKAFLYGVEPRYSVNAFARSVIGMAETDPKVAAIFDSIQTALGDGRSIVSEKHSDMFERLKCRRAVPDIPTAPEWLRPVIAAGYLRARQAMATRTRPILQEDVVESLKSVQKMIRKLEEDFIGELLVETTLAAREDRGFSDALAAGAAEFRDLVNDVYGAIDPDRTQSTALARSAPQAGGGGSCQACRTSGGQRRCEPISCWVIVVIVIIIIVAK